MADGNNEATWANIESVGDWQADIDPTTGKKFWWRRTSVDDNRGARQERIQPGTDYAFETVSDENFNGGNPDPGQVEYKTAGTSVDQHTSTGAKILSKVVPAFIGAVAGGGLLSSLGYGPYAGQVAADLGLGGSSGLGGAAAGLNGTPAITPEMLAAANATSDPIAYLAAQANAVAPGSWGALDPAYLASLTTVPPGTMTPGYQAPPDWPATTAATTAASTAASTAAKAAETSGLLKSIADKTGISEDILKMIIPGLGAAATYFDAASKDGERNGYQPSTDMLTAHMNKSPMQNRQQFSDLVNRGPQNITPQYTTSLAGGQPQFSTGLLPIPPVGQRTGYQHPQLAQSGLLLNNPFRRPIG